MDCNYCVGIELNVENPLGGEAYVPNQNLCSLFNEDEALVKGTVFPQLYRPMCKYYKKGVRQ